ncbi:MAG: hypothetical protein PHP56_12635, partial [Smithellaceae bacterium]|nr:hypothetical protein [Smithellaceae bacterium]
NDSIEVINDKMAKQARIKEENNKIQDVLNTAIENGAPSSVLEAVSKSNNYLDAVRVAGKYATDYLKREQLVAQIEKTKSGSSGGAVAGYETSNLTKEDNTKLDELGLSPHQKEIVSGIVSGTQPPITTIQRTPEITKILGGLAKLGYDNTKAVQDWTSMQKRLSSMNSATQLRLSQAVFALEGSVEQARRLYSEWQDTGLPTGFSSFNRVALKAASELPGEKGVVARTLISHIEDMAAELATIYRGGNTATDMALEQARRSLDSNWNKEQFDKNLELISQNLKIRKNSIVNSAYIAGNIYNPEIQGVESVFGEEENPFAEALGVSTKQIEGTGIIESVSNGIINFLIPNE